MNSPVEDRLREALAEAGAAVDQSALRPLRVPERRRFRMDYRLVTAVVAVAVAGSAVAVLTGGGAEGGRDQLTAASVFSRADADVTVFLCTATAPKETGCTAAAGPEQRRMIERVLREQQPQIAASQWVSQATAYDDFRERYAGNQALLDAVRPADLPPSYQVKLRQGADRRQVTSAFLKVGGVSAVIDHAESADAMAAAQKGQKTDVNVFLCTAGTSLPACAPKPGSGKKGVAATADQVKAIQQTIQQMPEVKDVVFEDQAAAYENFKQAFKDNKALVEATRVQDMPQSFRIRLKSDAPAWALVDKLKRQPGVAQVVSHWCIDERAALHADFGLYLPDRTVCPGGA
ncbi:Cell division protein FtsX [[Actinomadura] parvosata subsp. kistnae]|uniref:permease-like cell division protein FtsX n=1 Tax=[Actinomadura] parvosata TaxID=1955412 RepID=UPI000D2D883F|nr:permease-like cell division protein FtsX [Nonomuraea sp. ATCC 55076]SPL93649.1 Cell division protein FtsX [Actinomadura parvosata subsp. kistnae]